jgi:hypothetical protein
MEPHLLQRLASERTSMTTTAVKDHLAPAIFEPRVAFAVFEVGAHFEKTAWKIPSARNVPSREFIRFSHVNEIPARVIRFLENLRSALG